MNRSDDIDVTAVRLPFSGPCYSLVLSSNIFVNPLTKSVHLFIRNQNCRVGVPRGYPGGIKR